MRKLWTWPLIVFVSVGLSQNRPCFGFVVEGCCGQEGDIGVICGQVMVIS